MPTRAAMLAQVKAAMDRASADLAAESVVDAMEAAGMRWDRPDIPEALVPVPHPNGGWSLAYRMPGDVQAVRLFAEWAAQDVALLWADRRPGGPMEAKLLELSRYLHPDHEALLLAALGRQGGAA